MGYPSYNLPKATQADSTYMEIMQSSLKNSADFLSAETEPFCIVSQYLQKQPKPSSSFCGVWNHMSMCWNHTVRGGLDFLSSSIWDPLRYIHLPAKHTDKKSFLTFELLREKKLCKTMLEETRK